MKSDIVYWKRWLGIFIHKTLNAVRVFEGKLRTKLERNIFNEGTFENSWHFIIEKVRNKNYFLGHRERNVRTILWDGGITT